MSGIVPKTPAEWREYAGTDGFDRLPNSVFVTSDLNASTQFIERGICVSLETSQALKSKAQRIWIVADVLVIDSSVTFTLQPSQSVSIYARRITSDAPTTINMVFPREEPSQVLIYCAQVDQEVSYQYPDLNAPIRMKLGDPSIAGIAFNAQPNTKVEPIYKTVFPLLDLSPLSLSDLIRTQLRIATILYWTSPDVAIDICSWVAKATENQEESTRLHLQANAIGQQILAEKTVQKGVTYLPVLDSNSYRQNLRGAIQTAEKYQRGYDTLNARDADLKNQEAGWDVMLSQAADNMQQQQVAADAAFARWENANAVYVEAQFVFSSRVISLEHRASELKAGIDQYVIRKGAELFIAALTTVIAFAGAIGGLAVGMPQGMGGAVTGIDEVAKAASKAKLQSDTLIWLFKVTESLSKLMDTATKLVPIVKAVQTDPKSKIKLDGKSLSPNFSTVQGGDATALESVAAWDRWLLEADAQMSFAVSNGIAGASKYQLELRMHAIDGKLAAQAQAMAVKTSGEYLLAVMGLNAARESVERLTKMRESYRTQAEGLLDARTAYFDRLQEARTNILVRMRAVQLAQRYEILQDSKVILNPLEEDISSYEQKADSIFEEHMTYLSGRVDDPPTIAFTRNASELAPEYGQVFHTNVIRAFKAMPEAPPAALSDQNRSWAAKVLVGTGHKISFTISPNLPAAVHATDPTTQSNATETTLPPITDPFTGASHVRLFGMRVFLIGVAPSQAALLNKKVFVVNLRIRTTGIYNDIDGNENVLTFSTQPMSRRFQYKIDKSGRINREAYDIDSVVENKDHVNPTPFAQWSVQIMNPDDLDLSGLTDVEFQWPGKAYS